MPMHNAELAKLKADPAPQFDERHIADIKANSVWKDDRRSRTTYVLVSGVRGNHVTVKRNADAKDSTTMTVKEFVKKYKPAVGNEGKADVRLT